MSFAHMKTMIQTKGSTIRQSKINDGRRLMKHQLKTDPSYRDEFYFWEFNVDIDSLENAPVKVFNEKYSPANGILLQFDAPYDSPIVIGDMLYDKENDLYWICVESFNRDGILYSGKLVRCVNNKMRWQKSNGDICEYPVFEINSTQYNSGESGNEILTLGSSQHLITIIVDENTIELNHDRRFFWDKNTVKPTVFKITQNDTTSLNYDKGLLKITVVEDEYNPETDSIENWLCDYISPTDILSPSSPITISHFGKPEMRIGSKKTFNANIPVVYSIVVADIWKNKVKLSQTSDSSCVVNCENDSDMVGASFKIVATDSNNVESQILVKITGGV